MPFGQIEAARACGMSRSLIFRRIIVPQGLIVALPAYGNEIILMTRSTALASVITLMEVTGIASKIIAETFRAVEVFVCAGAIYLILNFAISRGDRAPRAAAVAAIPHTGAGRGIPERA